MNGKLAVAVLLLACPLVFASPAAALVWGVGAEVGGTLFMPGSPDDTGEENGVATFAWPMVGPAMYQVGGLRVSFAGSHPAHEIWLGTTYSSFTTEGRTNSRFMLAANYQYNFSSSGRMAPFVTGGVGAISFAGSGLSATAAVFGVGAGLAWRVTDGAGRFRGELRFDQQTEGRSGDFGVIRDGSTFGVRFGFDLWVR